MPKLKSKSQSSTNGIQEKEVSVEDKISEYLKDKSGVVNLNFFLKGLFPVRPNQPANLADSTYVRGVLDKMQREVKFKVVNDNHKKLGKTYYPPYNDNRAAQYNLDTVVIDVEIPN